MHARTTSASPSDSCPLLIHLVLDVPEQHLCQQAAACIAATAAALQAQIWGFAHVLQQAQGCFCVARQHSDAYMGEAHASDKYPMYILDACSGPVSIWMAQAWTLHGSAEGIP